MDDEFHFKKLDNIGQAAAENDDQFFSTCFVNTGDYDEVANPESPYVIAIGRTGSGKSALVRRLYEEKTGRVIIVNPEQLALSETASSQMIQFAMSLGVNLDPLFKLLWRHVFAVEALNLHFKTVQHKPADSSIYSWIVQRFSQNKTEQKQAEKCVQYLRKWGEHFWETTEVRVREIVKTIEQSFETEIASALGTKNVASLDSALKASAGVSDQIRADLKRRVQTVVSSAQARDLQEVVGILERMLSNKHKCYYILVDRLDENWIQDELQSRLIKALVLNISEFISIKGLKVFVAVRRDLIDRVIRDTRDKGFQEEKIQGLYLPLNWEKKHLLQALDLRINCLVRRRYTKKKISYRDILPSKFDRLEIGDFITKQCTRPRDVIALLNSCINESVGSPKITRNNFGRALGDYSRGRLKALADEWYAELPDIDFVTPIFRNRPVTFELSDVEDDTIDRLATRIASSMKWSETTIGQIARRLEQCEIQSSLFRSELFYLLYRIGMVGLKVSAEGTVAWRTESGQVVSHAEITDKTRIAVRAAYQRVLGCRMPN